MYSFMIIETRTIIVASITLTFILGKRELINFNVLLSGVSPKPFTKLAARSRFKIEMMQVIMYKSLLMLRMPIKITVVRLEINQIMMVAVLTNTATPPCLCSICRRPRKNTKNKIELKRFKI